MTREVPTPSIAFPLPKPTTLRNIMADGSSPQAYQLQGAAALHQAVTLLDECCFRFSASITAAISALQIYHDSTLQTLKSEKELLTRAMETVQIDTEAKLVLARVMRTFSTGRTQAFSYFLAPPDIAKLCSAWMQWENRFGQLWKQASVAVKSAKPLCFINKEKLKIFSLSTYAWQIINLSKAISGDSNSQYLWLKNDLFCSGGREY